MAEAVTVNAAAEAAGPGTPPTIWTLTRIAAHLRAVGTARSHQ
ncbi:hypothetical protein [Streptomyces sp. NPDC088554]